MSRPKLFGVRTKHPSSSKWQYVYVIANNYSEAEEEVLKQLNDREIGFSSNRVVIAIDLLADSYVYSHSASILITEMGTYDSND